MTATALLGAFLFLLVASFLVLPCLNAQTTGLFSSVSGPQACQEQKMFKAQADLTTLKLLPAETVFRFDAVLPAVIGAGALLVIALASRARPPGSIRVRSGTLPFVTSDPPRLPAFAALRDA